MTDNQNVSAGRDTNAWKVIVLAITGVVLLLVIGGFTVAALNSSEPETEQAQAAAPPVSEPAPAQVAVAPQPRENCDQYRVATQRDNTGAVKNGAIGAVVGGGTGAAGGAIADGSSGAGKGAGIGAVVGAVAGGTYGVMQENTRIDDAELAYQNCLARSY